MRIIGSETFLDQRHALDDTVVVARPALADLGE